MQSLTEIPFAAAALGNSALFVRFQQKVASFVATPQRRRRGDNVSIISSCHARR